MVHALTIVLVSVVAQALPFHLVMQFLYNTNSQGGTIVY